MNIYTRYYLWVILETLKTVPTADTYRDSKWNALALKHAQHTVRLPDTGRVIKELVVCWMLIKTTLHNSNVSQMLSRPTGKWRANFKKMLKIPANMSKLLIEKMPHHAAVEKKWIFIQICKNKICLFISLGQVKL